MGENEKALKATGPLIYPDSSNPPSQSDLYMAILQARLLNVLGCIIFANRLLENIKNFIEDKNHLQHYQLTPYFYSHLANNQVEVMKLDHAEISAKKYKHQLIQLGMYDDPKISAGLQCLDLFWRLAYYKGHDDLAWQYSKEQFARITGNNHLWFIINSDRAACLHNVENNLEKMRHSLDQSEKIISKNLGAFPLEERYWTRLKIQYLTQIGKIEEAKALSLKEKDPIKESGYGPEFILSTFYYMEKVDSKILTFEEKLALRAHPNANYFSYMTGRNLGGLSKEHLPAWCQQELPSSNQNDVWLIKNQEIKATTYAELRSKIFDRLEESKESMLDLQSGILQWEDKKITLTDTQSMALLGLAGAGALGIDKWSLMEFIYRQIFTDPIVGLDRLSKLITTLKKYGLKIEFKEKDYFFDISEFTWVILPMKWHGLGLHHLAFDRPGDASSIVERPKLKKCLNAKDSTLESWIREWKGLFATAKN